MKLKLKDLTKNNDDIKNGISISSMKMNESIKDMVEQVMDSGSTINEILNETDCLAVLNKAKMNNFLNSYIGRLFDSADGVSALNNKLLAKLQKNKDSIPPSEYLKLYLKSRELELDQIKLVNEFMKCSNVKLELEEQNMIIIYRSLPRHLKGLMYKTVLEFIRKCPAIQRELKRQEEIESLEKNQPEELEQPEL